MQVALQERNLDAVFLKLVVDAVIETITDDHDSLHYLISFQETEGDVFNFLRERFRKAKGRIRKSICEYLAYALIDAIVDHYFLVLEKMGEKIEQLEEDLLGDTQTKTLQSIHHLFFLLYHGTPFISL